MSELKLIHGSCADQKVDAVVNAANNRLLAGGGICGVIFRKAGMIQLSNACRAFSVPLEDGSAVLTSAYGLTNAKAIIHAVGPDFGKNPEAFDALEAAYFNSLRVLMGNGLHSVAFPLISSGIFGGSLRHPAVESAKCCRKAYARFVKACPDWDVQVLLCAFSDREMEEISSLFEEKKSPIFARVSIRKFEKTPVDQDQVEKILRAAMAAPSATNQQPWEFYVVRDPETILALSKATPYSGAAAGAPLVFVPCYRNQGLRAPMYADIDLSAAVENMLLEITELGLGAVWMGVSPQPALMEKVAEILHAPENLTPFAIVPCGYPAESRPQQDRFDPARVHYVP